MTIKEAAEVLNITEQSMRLFLRDGIFGRARKNKKNYTYIVNENEVNKYRKEGNHVGSEEGL